MLDVIVFGATGFTGRLVCEYLSARYTDCSIKWGIAGRSKEKLDNLAAELNLSVPAIVCNSSDREALLEMCARTKVILTTVGPYLKFGFPLVEACAETGTSYVDLTGETPFVLSSAKRYDAKAKASGATIVHCCGFDSIPSDLGALLLAEHFREKHGRCLGRTKFIAWDQKGGASGGTLASVRNVLDNYGTVEHLKEANETYGLNPPGTPKGPDTSDVDGIVRWCPDAKSWTWPFIMAGVNAKVVRRSNALLGHKYGKNFSYCK